MLVLIISLIILVVFITFGVLKYIDYKKVLRYEITQEKFEETYRIYFLKMIKSIIIPLIVLAGMVLASDLLTKDFLSDFTTINKEGTILDCKSNDNNSVLSDLGLAKKTNYKTVIKVDNAILESNKKEVYYSCKDKIDSNIKVEVIAKDNEIIGIKSVME